MVDYFSLALSHGVLLLAFWRLAMRDDLDRDPPREGEEREAPGPPARVKPLRRA